MATPTSLGALSALEFFVDQVPYPFDALKEVPKDALLIWKAKNNRLLRFLGQICQRVHETQTLTRIAQREALIETYGLEQAFNTLIPIPMEEALVSIRRQRKTLTEANVKIEEELKKREPEQEEVMV